MKYRIMINTRPLPGGTPEGAAIVQLYDSTSCRWVTVKTFSGIHLAKSYINSIKDN